MGEQVLITGGAGFIGSHFTRYLLEKYRDWEVVVLDKLTYAGKRENLKGLENNPSFFFVQGDVGDLALLEGLFSQYRFTVIFHLAAETHVDRSIQDPLLMVRNNVLGTGVLLEASRRFGVQRFLLISTDEVYGSLGLDDPPFTEFSPLSPKNPYAASKGSGDLLAFSYYYTFGFPVIVTRCSNNYGPNQDPEKFIPLMITRILRGEKIPIYGTGENRRDWIYVEDHCRALDLIYNRGEAGKVYTIGAGEEKSNRELVETVLQIMGVGKEMMEFVADRPGHDLRYALDFSLLEELGFAPNVSLKEGLPKVVQWYRDRPSWWS